MVALGTDYSRITHLDLPDTDGTPVDNDFQPLQRQLLTAQLADWVRERHPTGDYLMAQDIGIYWTYVADEPLRGCKSPDWCYVPGCSPNKAGEWRRSYVLWQEKIAPLIVVEIVSGTGAEEHDDTPMEGRFWVYERAVKAAYYAIYDPQLARIELFRLEGDEYRPVEPNARGHYPIPEMGLALGTWNGARMNVTAIWLRFFDINGAIVPEASEMVDREKRLAERARERAREAFEQADLAREEAREARKRAEQAETMLAQLMAKMGSPGTGAALPE